MKDTILFVKRSIRTVNKRGVEGKSFPFCTLIKIRVFILDLQVIIVYGIAGIRDSRAEFVDFNIAYFYCGIASVVHAAKTQAKLYILVIMLDGICLKRQR